MLRSFRVANHKSIRAEQEMLLVPSYEKDRPVVQVAAVYGGNASGKSNLIDALRWMRSAVRLSVRQWEAEGGVPRSPFRLDLAALGEPSSYSVDLLLDGVQYLYGFAVDDTQVTEEWLYAYHPTRRKTVLFERGGNDVTLGDSIPERKSRSKVLSSSLRPNALLLSLAMQLGGQQEFAPVHRWFERGVLMSRHDPNTLRRHLPQRIEAALGRDAGLLSLAQVADLDIRDIQVEQVMEEPSVPIHNEVVQVRMRAVRLRSRRELVFLQGSEHTPMSIDDQSDGTLAYLNLVAQAIEALARGAFLVVDEIDMSLHPRLTARLIELFRDARANPHQAQLLFTTHDVSLLGTSFGEEILRRDEIWFVEKREGATTLYPLTDFHPRQEENRERRYLGGSYGAVPAVFSDSLVDGLLDAQQPDAREETTDGRA